MPMMGLRFKSSWSDGSTFAFIMRLVANLKAVRHPSTNMVQWFFPTLRPSGSTRSQSSRNSLPVVWVVAGFEVSSILARSDKFLAGDFEFMKLSVATT